MQNIVNSSMTTLAWSSTGHLEIFFYSYQINEMSIELEELYLILTGIKCLFN